MQRTSFETHRSVRVWSYDIATPEGRLSDQLLIENVRLAQPAGEPLMEILIGDGVIRSVEPQGTQHRADLNRIDAKGGVGIPGLINAHAHTHALFMRGAVWGVPLEEYVLRIAPRLEAIELPDPEDIYVRTLAACAEMLRGGTTMAVDDVAHPSIDERYVDAVLQAYEDIGMRARVSIHLEDLPWIDSVPILKEILPERLHAFANEPATSLDVDVLADFCARNIERWRGRGTTVGVIVAPSAPERCSPELLKRFADLARDMEVPYHIHVQESLAQAICGPVLFGSTLVQYLDRLGALSKWATIAHGVWLDSRDIATLANVEASVVHNPVANLKLGSGVAPVREMLDAGVNVALGCDGFTSNDTQDMFESMKTACLVSCLARLDPTDWLGPGEAIQMATRNGARANQISAIGEIEVGNQADIILLNPTASAFMPLNDVAAQLVFGARQSDVRTVLVQGRIVVRDGIIETIDESSVIDRARDAAQRFWNAARSALEKNEALIPYVREAHARAVELLPQIGQFRSVPDGRTWTAAPVVGHRGPE